MNWKFWKKSNNDEVNKVDFDNLRITGFCDTNQINKG